MSGLRAAAAAVLLLAGLAGCTADGKAEVSVKLSAVGQTIDESLALDNARTICEAARKHGTTVTLDMEDHTTTDSTLEILRDLRQDFGWVGAVLQAYLYRTEADCRDLAVEGSRVRLCKGAYKEPPAIAYPKKADVDSCYVRCLERLLARANYPGIATHDERILAHAKAYACQHGIPPERFEFQMLYGVRRDLQMQLRREGWRVRVYVPFGTHWYPYLMRRLAERPANIAFIVGNVVKESLRRR